MTSENTDMVLADALAAADAFRAEGVAEALLTRGERALLALADYVRTASPSTTPASGDLAGVIERAERLGRIVAHGVHPADGDDLKGCADEIANDLRALRYDPAPETVTLPDGRRASSQLHALSGYLDSLRRDLHPIARHSTMAALRSWAETTREIALVLDLPADSA